MVSYLKEVLAPFKYSLGIWYKSPRKMLKMITGLSLLLVIIVIVFFPFLAFAWFADMLFPYPADCLWRNDIQMVALGVGLPLISLLYLISALLLYSYYGLQVYDHKQIQITKYPSSILKNILYIVSFTVLMSLLVAPWFRVLPEVLSLFIWYGYFLELIKLFALFLIDRELGFFKNIGYSLRLFFKKQVFGAITLTVLIKSALINSSFLTGIKSLEPPFGLILILGWWLATWMVGPYLYRVYGASKTFLNTMRAVKN